MTALSLSSSTVSFGDEQAVKFSVKLSAGSPGTGVPSGYVAVESGTRLLCSIHVYHRGRGSCSPAARALAPGSYRIVAHYSGNRHYFKPSTSRPKTLTVLRHSSHRKPSVTALSLSSSTVSFGDEQAVKFSVKLSAGSPGTGVPSGYVAVESGTRLLCSIHVYHRGRGSCSPAARALAPGSYRIVAHYSGNRHYFKPSTSRPKTLTVLRHSSHRKPSVTALSLSSSTVSFGDEQAVKFSVKLSAGSPGTGVPSGYVAVESGTRLLCSIHVYHRGRGSCSPAARALAPGSYRIVAHYSGNRHYFKPSTSRPKTLTVLRH